MNNAFEDMLQGRSHRHCMTNNQLGLDLSVLAELADKTLAKDVEKFTGFSSDIQAALEEEIKMAKENAAKNAAKEVIKLINAADDKIKATVVQLREIRRMEADMKKHLEKLSAAKEHGMKTSNFIPLATMVGCELSAFDRYMDSESLSTLSKIS